MRKASFWRVCLSIQDTNKIMPDEALSPRPHYGNVRLIAADGDAHNGHARQKKTVKRNL